MKKRTRLYDVVRLLLVLATGSVLVSSSFALAPEEDELLPSGELSTTQLMKLVKKLLEHDMVNDAVPYLEEALVRLEGDDDEDVVAARAEVMYRLGLCYLDTSQFISAAELFQTFVDSYPGHDYALVAPVMTLEAFARSGDSVQMTAYIDSLEDQGGFARLTAALNDPAHADACRHALSTLMEAYAQSSDLDRFEQFLPFCDEDVLCDMGLNWSLLDGGDLAMEEGQFLDALQLYRLAKTAEELMAGSERRLKAMKAELDKELKWVAIRDRAAQQAERASDEQHYEMLLADCKAFDAERYSLDLMVRMAQCYDGMGRQWLAIPVFRHIYTEFPESHVAERSRFFAFSSLLGVQEFAQALDEGGAYSDHYPNGRFRDEVSLGMMHAQLGLKNFDATDELGHSLLVQVPEHRYVDQVNYLLGYTQFQRGNYEAALPLFQETATNWPDRIYAEESTYWVGMCTLFLGDFEGAVGLFEHYLTESEWSPRAFEEEVTYRLGVAYYGLEDDAQAETVFLGFLDRFPDSDLVSEAYSMMGDLVGAKGELDSALDYFEKGRETAVNPTQFDYALFQSARVFELLERHEDIIALMTDYLQTPDREGRFAEAAGWLSQSWRMLGENGKALDACCETLAQYGNDPQAVGVDTLVEEIQAAVNDPDRGAQLLARAKSMLEPAREEALGSDESKTLALYLTVLLAEWSDGAERAAYEEALLAETTFDAFAPLPLLHFAEAAAARGQSARVREAYDYFVENFGASGQALEMANIGISSLLEDGENAEALALAQATLSRYADDDPATAITHKLAGDALRLTGKYDEAVKMYSQLIGRRAWRGPLTPQALYWSAVCKQSQGDDEAAFTYFQRVYVLYTQYPEWVAKAYASSVDCLRALGRADELPRTWREMVANPEVAQTPEGREAQAELDKLQEVAP